MANTSIIADVFTREAIYQLSKSIGRLEARPMSHWVDVELAPEDLNLSIANASEKFIVPAIEKLADKCHGKGSAFHPVQRPNGFVDGVNFREMEYGRLRLATILLPSINDTALSVRFCVAFY